MNNGTVLHSYSSSSLGSSTSSRSSSSDANNNSTFDKNVNTIQASSHTSHKKKPSTKSSSVHPEESYEKSYGVPINTDIGGDIEEGRQPIESGSLQGQVSHRRSKLVLWSILICNVLVIVGATIAAIVKGLQGRNIVSMEDYDSTVTLSTQTTSTSATTIQNGKITSTMETETALFVAPPINDYCEGAIYFPLDDLPRMEIGSTLGATPEEHSPFYESCGVFSGAKGVWYTFRGNGHPIVIYSHIVHTGRLGEKTQISLFGGASCSTLICDTDFGSSDLIQFVPHSKKRYWLLLTGKTSSVVGDYELWIGQEHETEDGPILIRPTLSSAAEFALYGTKSSTSSTTTEPKQLQWTEYEVPDNDRCENATVVGSLPTVLNGSTFGATPSLEGSIADDTPCGSDWNFHDVWYRFVGSGRIVSFDLTILNQQEATAWKMGIFFDSCTPIDCIDSIESKDIDDLHLLVEEGKVLYFRIFSGTSVMVGDFRLSLSEQSINDHSNSNPTRTTDTEGL